MSREIRFRAWDKGHQRMIHLKPHTMLAYDTEDAKLVFGEDFHDDFTSSTASNFDLMQFTGLEDRNGKEIYEADIVKAYTKYGWPEDDQRVVIYAVVFSEFEGCWALKDERKIEDCPSLYRSGIYSRRDEQLEIIGNIYENPELVEMRG